MLRFCLCCAWWLLSAFCLYQQQTPTVFLVGDSTVSDFADRYAPMAGWGTALHTFFNEQIRVDNRAIAGKSSRSFIEEGKWNRVLADVQAGDYLLIQFGHNDQKEDYRYTAPYGSYQNFLSQYVHDTRRKGGIPVLVTPVARRRFGADGALHDTHGSYPEAVRALAKTLDVPLIDLNQRSLTHFETLGAEGTKEVFLWLAPGEEENYPHGREDDTHFSEQGARTVSQLVVDALKTLDLPLKNYLKDCEVRTESRLDITEGDSVLIGSHYRGQAGLYYDTLRSVTGCDSIIVSDVRVVAQPAPTSAVQLRQQVQLCSGDSLWAQGRFRQSSGTFYDTLVSPGGYDSIIVTHLEMAPPIEQPTIEVTGEHLTSSVAGDAYRWFFEDQPLPDTTAAITATRSGRYSVSVRVGTCTSAVSGAYQHVTSDSLLVMALDEEVGASMWVSTASSHRLTVNVGSPLTAAGRLYVHNVQGQLLYATAWPAHITQQLVPLAPSADGTYIVTIVTPQQRIAAKVCRLLP